jgi:hypothetical protein
MPLLRWGRSALLLVDGGIAFILVGGVAANAHGSVRTTADVDVVYRRTAEKRGRYRADARAGR